MRCPQCGQDYLETRQYEDFETRFEGVDIVVPLATFRECQQCGDRVYGAGELKHWKTIKEATERDALQRWINDLQSQLYINCVYCGHRYGPNEKEVPADALRQHVACCPEHPMAELVASCKEAVEAIGDEMSPTLNRIYRILTLAINKATK